MIITNPQRSDGFGAQFQTIIYSYIFSKLTNNEFIYTPFEKMEHNYEDNTDFIEKKEELINFKNSFKHNYNDQIIFTYPVQFFINFFEKHINDPRTINELKLITKIFKNNKQKPFTNKTIVIHIRRKNKHDNRIEGTDIPIQNYITLINEKKQEYNIIIHSQGSIEEFKDIPNDIKINIKLNTSVEESFTDMVFADILVSAKSSFSYTAALLNEGIIYYIPFWHKPMNNWITINL